MTALTYYLNTDCSFLMLNKQDKFLPQQHTQYNLVNEGPFYYACIFQAWDSLTISKLFVETSPQVPVTAVLFNTF